ncbi:MAG: alcohol dehydrogenase catalytic domain-containing protein [Caldilineales bacterium]|nr:alcohol dehydrogenase catalytic domain-containing protein [Caldilineales bacterium]
MRTIYVDKDIPRMLAVKAVKPVWGNVVYSRLSSSRFVDLPDPELPGPRWIRLKNRMCGICATDLSLLTVDADPKIAPAALPGHQRFYLGHEVVSTVEEVGPDVTTLKVGDRVIMWTRFQGANCLSQEIEPPCRQCEAGNYPLCENASKGIGPRGVGGGWGDGYTAHEFEVYPVPDTLSDEQAMMVEPLGVGVHTALRKLPQADERALIVGSGIAGLCTLQALRALSPACHISIMARYPHQQEMARKFGADEIIGSEDSYEAVARITGAIVYNGMMGNRMCLGGFDVVFDCVGSAQTIQHSLRWARSGGTVVQSGITLAPMHVDLTPIWNQEIDLIGLNSHGCETWNGKQYETFALTIELLQQGKLTIDGLVTHRFTLERWQEAIATAQDKRSKSIRVAFDYR